MSTGSVATDKHFTGTTTTTLTHGGESKLADYVQSSKTQGGRSIQHVRTIPERNQTQVRDARRAEQLKTLTPVERSTVHKAIPSSRAILNFMLALKQRISQPSAQQLLRHCAKTEVVIGNAAKLLTGDIPMGGPEWDQALTDLGKCETELNEQMVLLDRLTLSNPNSQHVRDSRAALNDALDQVTARKTYLQNFEGSHSLAQTKVADAKLGWAQAAARVIDAEIARLPGNQNGQLTDPRTAALEQLRDQILDTAQTAVDNADPKVTVADGGRLKEANKDFGKQIASKLKELGLKGNEKKLAKEVYEQHIDVLNERDWDPINKDIHFVHDGVPHTFQSDITPAAHLETTKSGYDGKGICCQSRSERSHMVNMATTTLKDTQGNTLFSGVRHGIVSAFGVKNKAERQAANVKRAEELFLGVIASKPGLMQAALNQQDGDAPLALDMTSINLLTPDPIRYFLGGKMGGGTDRAITRDQLNTLQNLDGQELSLKFTDDQGVEHTVRVKPDIATFSFGVNEGATRDGKAGALMWLGGGKQSFNHVRNDNKAALAKLIGDVKSDTIDPGSKIGKFLADPNRSDADKKIVTELRDQIRGIWNNDSYMVHGGDPHKMVSRISVLTHLLGDTPCFNCKSGKDRTGTLDVEAKFLATRIDFAKKQALANGDDPNTTKFVPDPGPLTTAEKAMFRQFALNSGNLEVQEFNTGIGGYKTAAQKALQNRLGTPEAVSRFKGGSAHVKA